MALQDAHAYMHMPTGYSSVMALSGLCMDLTFLAQPSRPVSSVAAAIALAIWHPPRGALQAEKHMQMHLDCGDSHW